MHRYTTVSVRAGVNQHSVPINSPTGTMTENTFSWRTPLNPSQWPQLPNGKVVETSYVLHFRVASNSDLRQRLNRWATQSLQNKNIQEPYQNVRPTAATLIEDEEDTYLIIESITSRKRRQMLIDVLPIEDSSLLQGVWMRKGQNPYQMWNVIWENTRQVLADLLLGRQEDRDKYNMNTNPAKIDRLEGKQWTAQWHSLDQPSPSSSTEDTPFPKRRKKDPTSFSRITETTFTSSSTPRQETGPGQQNVSAASSISLKINNGKLYLLSNGQETRINSLHISLDEQNTS